MVASDDFTDAVGNSLAAGESADNRRADQEKAQLARATGYWSSVVSIMRDAHAYLLDAGIRQRPVVALSDGWGGLPDFRGRQERVSQQVRNTLTQAVPVLGAPWVDPYWGGRFPSPSPRSAPARLEPRLRPLGETLADPIIAAALIGRLVHHADIIALKGDSYRTRNRRAQQTTILKTPNQ